MTITQLLGAPPTGRSTPLVIDASEYAARVVLQDHAVPWESTAHINFLRQTEGLLRPDARFVDLGAFVAQALAACPELVAAMGERSRAGYAVRTLLADDGIGAAAAELLAVAASTTGLPLVVQLPSPLVWIGWAHEVAGTGSAADFDLDQAENASMYVADWLRRLSGVSISVLLLDGREAGVVEKLDTYSPIHNAAEHYRWSVGLRRDESLDIHRHDTKAVVVAPEFWTEADVPVPEADLVLAKIPRSADPKTVLQRLEQWA